MLTTYFIIAGLGLLSMPSFRAKWKAENPNTSWFNSNWKGEYDYASAFDQPLAIVVGSCFWPAIPPMFVLYHLVKLTRAYKLPALLWSLLEIPGRIVSGNSPDFKKWIGIKPSDPFLLEGQREVEKLLEG